MAKPPDPPFKGPWSDLPPPEPPPRQPLLKPRAKGARASSRREPFIRNWRGLAVIVFLLFVAPLLASWVAHLIMERLQGGGF